MNAMQKFIAEVKLLLENATFTDGQGVILTQDAEAVEKLLPEAESIANALNA
jgi:hypothetical protein